MKFLWIGATKDPDLLRIEEKYLGRIKQHFSAERLSVPELKKKDPHQLKAQMGREAKSIDRKLGAGTFLVSLEETGKQLNSLQLCEFLQGLMERGVFEVTFLAGGHLGIPEGIKPRVDQSLSLSQMTLPHELARVTLLEQIYRAVTLMKGLPYHK